MRHVIVKLTVAFGLLGPLLTEAVGADREIPPSARIARQNYTLTLEVPEADGPRVLRLRMIWIPGGEFTMGSQDGAGQQGQAGSLPHKVRVTGFWMSECEITNDLVGAWQSSVFWAHHTLPAKMTDLQRRESELEIPAPRDDYREEFGERSDGNLPVTGITARAALEFCRWLTVRTGAPYRLPTEAEWDFAARGGKETAWSFGNDAKDLHLYAWFGEPRKHGVHPVAQKRPNPYGLYDMYGNAAEWVLDRWTEAEPVSQRTGGTAVDPWQRRDDFPYGIARGGDWASVAADTRSASRRKVDCRPMLVEEHPDWWHGRDECRTIGFRIVATLKPDAEKASSIRTAVQEEP